MKFLNILGNGTITEILIFTEYKLFFFIAEYVLSDAVVYQRTLLSLKIFLSYIIIAESLSFDV